tara:strand:+ start:7061 stop:7246 length:186 start_codon:yes stop_codon:yes gene_type:complete
MPKKELIGNQEGEEPQYLYHKSGVPKAILVHILGDGDCPKCWEEFENHFTDGVKVFKIISL